MSNTSSTPRRKHRKIAPPWQHFRRFPILCIARRFYAAWAEQQVQELASSRAEATVRIVCIADTHGRHDRLPPLPPGDLLIHAGDLTQRGTQQEAHDALGWLSAAPHPHKVFIAGNHDAAFADPPTRDALLAAHPDLVYLEDSSATLTIHGRPLTLYGSPRTPQRGAGVFQYPRGGGAWAIPRGTDVLVTHGPPKSHRDVRGHGCAQLRAALWAARPRLHVFGHVHGGGGVGFADWSPVQRAYERVCDAGTGWAPMLQVAARAVRTALVGELDSAAGAGRNTVFVNAAVVDDLQEGVLREAITVSFAFCEDSDTTEVDTGLPEIS